MNRVGRRGAVVSIVSLVLVGTLGATPASGVAGSWNWPDDHFPDGAWNRNIEPNAPDPAENIGRAGYLFEYCTNQLTLGWIANPAKDTDPAVFSLYLSVPSPDPGPEPDPFDYANDDDYLAAYEAWLAAGAPLYSAFLSGIALAAGDSQYTFTIPAEALAFGSRLVITANVSVPSQLGGRIPAADVNSLTCDLGETGVGGSDDPGDPGTAPGPEPAGLDPAARLPATGSGIPAGALGLGAVLLGLGAAITMRRRGMQRP